MPFEKHGNICIIYVLDYISWKGYFHNKWIRFYGLFIKFSLRVIPHSTNQRTDRFQSTNNRCQNELPKTVFALLNKEFYSKII